MWLTAGPRDEYAHALKLIRRRPVLLLAAALTLGAGIGVSTAAFGLVDGLLLQPIPIRDPGKVLVLWGVQPSDEHAHIPLTVGGLRRFRATSNTPGSALSDAAGVYFNGAFQSPADLDGIARMLNVTFVSGEFARVLGVVPAAGRALGPQDDAVGASPAVMISHRLWEEAYGGSPTITDRSLTVFGRRARIVGVLPRGFDYPRGSDAWIPIMPFTGSPKGDSSWVLVDVVGRLAAGAPPTAARDQFTEFLHRDFSARTEQQAMRGATASITELMLGSSRPLLIGLTTAVALLLAMTCANVLALVFSRAGKRSQEFALRWALGAGSSHIARLLGVEALFLAVMGGLFGIAVGFAVLRLLVAAAPADLPRLDAVGMNLHVFLYAAAVSVTVAVAFTRVPLWSIARSDLMASLRGGTRPRAWWPQSLVISQVALAVVVTIGACSLVRTIAALNRVDLGFAANNLLILRYDVPPGFMTGWQAKHQTEARVRADTGAAVARALMRSLVDAIAASPDVVGATPIILPPFSGSTGFDTPCLGEHQAATVNPGRGLWCNMEQASPATFAALGISLRQGRAFTESDEQPDSPAVVIVSEDLARHEWPDGQPLGQRLRLGDSLGTRATVVGVAGDTRYRDLRITRPTIYLPVSQFGWLNPYIAVRTRGDPAASIPTVRAAIRSVDSSITIPSVSTPRQLGRSMLGNLLFVTTVLAIVAGVAFLLAAAGVYGAVATWVQDRRHDIGVRLAIGADPRRVIAMVVRQTVTFALAGAAIGAAVALFGMHIARSVLYGVGPADPVTYAGATAMLIAVALLSCVVPIHRVARIDPSLALREPA